MEIRANKRWLQQRLKELGAVEPSTDQIAELKAIEFAIKSMRTARGAAAFRKQLKLGIVIMGSVAGGTGSTAPPLSVTAVPRKKAARKKVKKKSAIRKKRTPR